MHNLAPSRIGGLLLAFAFLPVFAFAQPVRANDVLRHCGQPTAEGIRVSDTTGALERNLWYGDNILHFEAAAGDWELSTAWQGHFAISGKALATQMPCLRDAIAEASARPVPFDYARFDHESRPEQLSSGLGIPFFWLIAILTVALIFVVVDPLLKPNASREMVPPPDIERAFRRPRATWPVIDRRKSHRLNPTKPI